MININTLISSGNNLNKENVEFSRYKSWEFCFVKFIKASQNEKISEKDYDDLALNLAFYLASWGMYRGSSFLLQNNYTIHIQPAKEIITFIKTNKEKIYNNQSLDWTTIESLTNTLTTHYNKFYKLYIQSKNKSQKKEKQEKTITDTLITKILLGTTGIVPAYDTNVKGCIKKLKEQKIPQTFNKNSYTKLLNYYEDKNNNKHFESLRKKLEKDFNKNYNLNIHYPKMKILDMCLWQYYKEHISKPNKPKK